MKLNTKTNVKGSAAKDDCRDQGLVDRPDRSVSREELCRLLSGGKSSELENRVVPSSWLDKFTAWISSMLWKKTVIGYQDENGFHYGTPPVNKESHAICD